MPMELELGLLIRHLNPYADVMRLSPGKPEDPEGALHREGVFKVDAAVLDQLEKAATTGVQDILLEMETRQLEYLSWQFKDLPHLVKRAVRIEYRHLYKKTEVWVTDHLLIGYEGSNGG